MAVPLQKCTAALLVAILLISVVPVISATEATVPTETVPAEISTETIPATEPEETVPEETEPLVHLVDSETEVYRICHELSQAMEARQILVFDTNTDKILYTKSVETGKVFPASITKLFSTYVALQYLDPNTIITAGDELDLVHEGSSMAYVGKGHQLRVKMLI